MSNTPFRLPGADETASLAVLHRKVLDAITMPLWEGFVPKGAVSARQDALDAMVASMRATEVSREDTPCLMEPLKPFRNPFGEVAIEF